MGAAGSLMHPLMRQIGATTRAAFWVCALAVAFEASRLLSRILAPDVVQLPYVAWLPGLSARLPCSRS